MWRLTPLKPSRDAASPISEGVAGHGIEVNTVLLWKLIEMLLLGVSSLCIDEAVGVSGIGVFGSAKYGPRDVSLNKWPDDPEDADTRVCEFV